jgi:hypothetical protein
MILFGGILSSVAVVLAAYFISKLVYTLTTNAVAAFIAGVGIFVLSTLYTSPPRVFHPEYYYLFFSIMGLYLIENDYPFGAGVSIAVASGFYQPGVIVAVVGLIRIFQKYRISNSTGLYIFGGALTIVLTLLPLAIAGALEALVTETILAVLIAAPDQSVLDIARSLYLALGPGLLLIPFGIAGWYSELRLNPHEFWWVAVLGAAYLLKTFQDLQTGKDIFMIITLLSIGLALLVYSSDNLGFGTVFVLFLLVSGGVWAMNPGGVIPEDVRRPTLDQSPTQDNSPDRIEEIKRSSPNIKSLLENRMKPESCHYYLRAHELEWLEYTGRDVNDPCGRLP